MKKIISAGVLVLSAAVLSFSAIASAGQTGEELLIALNSRQSSVVNEYSQLTAETPVEDIYAIYSRAMDLKNNYRDLCRFSRLGNPQFATQETIEAACLEHVKMVRMTTSMER